MRLGREKSVFATSFSFTIQPHGRGFAFCSVYDKHQNYRLQIRGSVFQFRSLQPVGQDMFLEGYFFHWITDRFGRKLKGNAIWLRFCRGCMGDAEFGPEDFY